MVRKPLHCSPHSRSYARIDTPQKQPAWLARFCLGYQLCTTILGALNAAGCTCVRGANITAFKSKTWPSRLSKLPPRKRERSRHETTIANMCKSNRPTENYTIKTSRSFLITLGNSTIPARRSCRKWVTTDDSNYALCTICNYCPNYCWENRLHSFYD